MTTDKLSAAQPPDPAARPPAGDATAADAAEWRALLATLHAAGLHLAHSDHPGRTLAETLLLLRGERGAAAPPTTAYADGASADALVAHEIASVFTAAGLVTVGYTDAAELTVAVEETREVHVIRFDHLLGLLLGDGGVRRRHAAPIH